MKIGRWAVWAGVIAMTATIVAACGGSSTPTAEAPLQKANTVVNVLQGVTINDFAPFLSASTYSVYNSQVDYMTYAPVVMVSKSDTIDYADSVAKSISHNADGSQYTVTLNNWTFSDGSPITASVVAWDANLMIADCNDSSSSNKFPYGGCGFALPPAGGPGSPAYLKSATAEGTNKVVFTLSGPANPTWFELDGLGQIMVFPQAQWDKGTTEATLAFMNSVANQPTNPVYQVVSGPYKFKKQVANEFVSFVPNPKYGGHKATANWTEYYSNSDAASFAALKKGTVNVGGLTPTEYPQASTFTKQGDSVTVQPTGYCWFGIMLNSAPNSLNVGAAFQDPKVRAALQYGVDENAMGKIFNGTFNGQNLWIPQYSAVPPVPQAISKAVFGSTSIPSPYAYDPAKGKALLESDGWKPNSSGVMEKNGVTLSFPVIYGNGSSEFQNAAVLLKQDWAQMGVQITLKSEPFNTQITYLDTNASAASSWAVNWYGGWCYEPNYYPDGYGMWSYYNSLDDYNLTAGWKDLSAKMAATYQPGTPAQNQKAMYNYAEATALDLPMLWTPYGLGVVVHAPYVHGWNSNFNALQDWTQINYVTISH